MKRRREDREIRGSGIPVEATLLLRRTPVFQRPRVAIEP